MRPSRPETATMRAASYVRGRGLIGLALVLRPGLPMAVTNRSAVEAIVRS